MFVHGDSLQACLIGIVVLDPDTANRWVKEKLGLSGQTMKQLCENKVGQSRAGT